MDEQKSRTEDMLTHSISQYRELLQHAERLHDLLVSCPPERLSEQAARLSKLQQAAGQHDEQLLPLLATDAPHWQKHELFLARQGFVESILELNKLLLPRIRGMMAVASAELEQLRGGRVALAGYAAPSRERKGLRGVG